MFNSKPFCSEHKNVTEILFVCDNGSELLSTWMFVLFYSYILICISDGNITTVALLNTCLLRDNFAKCLSTQKFLLYWHIFQLLQILHLPFCETFRMQASCCSAVVLCQVMALWLTKSISTETSHKSSDEGD